MHLFPINTLWHLRDLQQQHGATLWNQTIKQNQKIRSVRCYSTILMSLSEFIFLKLTLLVKSSKLPLDFLNWMCYCVQLYRIIISLT